MLTWRSVLFPLELGWESAGPGGSVRGGWLPALYAVLNVRNLSVPRRYGKGDCVLQAFCKKLWFTSLLKTLTYSKSLQWHWFPFYTHVWKLRCLRFLPSPCDQAESHVFPLPWNLLCPLLHTEPRAAASYGCRLWLLCWFCPVFKVTFFKKIFFFVPCVWFWLAGWHNLSFCMFCVTVSTASVSSVPHCDSRDF